MNTYKQLIGKHEGENAFVFGAGPSLWYNMHEPFFPHIKEHGIRIAVNSAVMAVPDFDYWISNDALCRRWNWWRKVKGGKGVRIVRDSWLKYKEELDGFLFFSPRPTSEGEINPDDEGLAYCSSVPTSIDLAIQMGCKKIFLFGVDHNDHKGRNHFWQFMPKHKQPIATPPAQGPWKQQKTVFPMNLLAYGALKEFADGKGVEIYNVSWIEYGRHLSKVKTFKRIEISDVRKKCT